MVMVFPAGSLLIEVPSPSTSPVAVLASTPGVLQIRDQPLPGAPGRVGLGAVCLHRGGVRGQVRVPLPGVGAGGQDVADQPLPGAPSPDPTLAPFAVTALEYLTTSACAVVAFTPALVMSAMSAARAECAAAEAFPLCMIAFVRVPTSACAVVAALPCAAKSARILAVALSAAAAAAVTVAATGPHATRRASSTPG